MAEQLPDIDPIPRFTALDSVDSTNNYALARIHAGLAQHGDCIIAGHQTAGKGQREKAWVTEAGTNALLSLMIRPDKIFLHEQAKLSILVSVAVHGFFSKLAGENTRIKWPNDLYWQDRKAGGILIENVIGSSGDWKWAVIGVGININQVNFDPGIARPVSLRQITGQIFDTGLLARDLATGILNAYNNYHPPAFKTLLDIYNLQLFKRNELVTLKKENRVFTTTIKYVAETGELVTGAIGIEERFRFGEIEWKLT